MHVFNNKIHVFNNEIHVFNNKMYLNSVITTIKMTCQKQEEANREENLF